MSGVSSAHATVDARQRHVGASASVNLDFFSGADDITPENTCAYVNVQMVARWAVGTATRAAIHYHRFYNRTTSTLFSTLLSMNSVTASGSVTLSAPTGSLNNAIRVTVANSGGSSEFVGYACTVTVHSSPQPIV